MSQPIRILYVDDYPLDRELVRDALEEEYGGFRLTEASSRQEFETRLAEGEYDLVLSDFNILGFEGLDVIDAVRARDPRLPVVIVTGTGSEEIAVEAMKRGADDYVIKSPARIRRLPRTIHAVLEKGRLKEEQGQAQEALRESEERNRLLFDHAGVGIGYYDLEGKLLLLNHTAAAHLDGSPQDFVGKTIVDLFGRENALVYLARIRKAATSHETQEYEDTVRLLTGEKWFLSSYTRILDSNGCVLGVQIISHDITGRKRAEEELQQLYEQTRQDAEAKATLLQEVHHRVKNNLQIISSLLDLQADQIQDPQVLYALQDSRHRVRAMALVHENLYQAPDLAHLDLGRYVNELQDYLAGAYEGSALRLDLEWQGAAVLLDLDRAIPCGLILTELVSNALRHAFPDGRAGTIQISLRAHEGQVELEVRDDGAGLPTGVDPQAATSLGLKIVQLLTRQLGGTLAVHSAVDRGTTFTVTFPYSG